MKKNIDIIMSVYKDRGIGYKGKIPIKLKQDLNYFYKITNNI